MQMAALPLVIGDAMAGIKGKLSPDAKDVFFS
jgi:hypothetical protein